MRAALELQGERQLLGSSGQLLGCNGDCGPSWRSESRVSSSVAVINKTEANQQNAFLMILDSIVKRH